MTESRKLILYVPIDVYGRKNTAVVVDIEPIVSFRIAQLQVRLPVVACAASGLKVLNAILGYGLLIDPQSVFRRVADDVVRVVCVGDRDSKAIVTAPERHLCNGAAKPELGYGLLLP